MSLDASNMQDWFSSSRWFVLGETEPAAPLPVVKLDTEIMGWRAWSLTKDENGEPILYSATKRTMWQGPTLTADELPAPNSAHGIYCYKPDLKDKAKFYGYIYGEVALSGRVVELDFGYRAERAIIRALHIAPPTVGGALDGLDLQDLARSLSARYGVEVVMDPWSEEAKAEYFRDLEVRKSKIQATKELTEAMANYAKVMMAVPNLCVALMEDNMGNKQMVVGAVDRLTSTSEGPGSRYDPWGRATKTTMEVTVYTRYDMD